MRETLTGFLLIGDPLTAPSFGDPLTAPSFGDPLTAPSFDHKLQLIGNMRIFLCQSNMDW